MSDADLEKMSEWLDITKQQLMIITIINKLGSQSVLASPKNICEEFKKYENKSLHKSNLFTQIKALADKGFISKAGKADYIVVPQAIKADLTHKKEELLAEATRVEKVYRSLDDMFVDAVKDSTEQMIDYLDYHTLFEVLEHRLRYAKEYYLVARFPNISFSHSTFATLGRGKYRDTILHRCLEEKTLKTVFMTQLSIPYIFDRSMMVFNKDASAAYKECEYVIRNLDNQVQTYDTLDVRYLEKPFGFDVAIPVIDEPNEFFMFIRDDSDMIVGGMHIKSKRIARKAYEQFTSECASTKPFKGAYADEITKKLLRELDVVYAKHVNVPEKKAKRTPE